MCMTMYGAMYIFTCLQMHRKAHIATHAQTCTNIQPHIHTPPHRDMCIHTLTKTYQTDMYIYKCTRITLSLKKKTAYEHIFIETLEIMYKIINIIIHYEFLYFPRTIYLLTTIL